jgi:GH18 family chitinase
VLAAACGGGSNDQNGGDSGAQGPQGGGHDGGGLTTDGGAAHEDGGGGASDGDASSNADGGTKPDGGHPSGGDDGGDTGTTPEAGPVQPPAIKAVMYLPNWNGSFADWAGKIDFDKMTHLLLAFGTVNGNNDWDLGAADGDVQTLAAAAHAHQVKVLVSIGGASDDIGILNQYGNKSNIAPMVANLDAFVSKLDLDGVDVDLERGAMMKSSSNYPAFVSALLATFHPEGKLVTTALAQYIAQDANTDKTLQAVYQSFDFINDMIYTTNLSDYTNEAQWWTGTQGIEKTKLTLGIEFTNNLSTSTATTITTTSKGYGGIMIWEYTQPTESKLWPAVQGAL